MKDQENDNNDSHLEQLPHFHGKDLKIQRKSHGNRDRKNKKKRHGKKNVILREVPSFPMSYRQSKELQTEKKVCKAVAEKCFRD